MNTNSATPGTTVQKGDVYVNPATGERFTILLGTQARAIDKARRNAAECACGCIPSDWLDVRGGGTEEIADGIYLPEPTPAP
jgi:hypothetical protein